MDLFDENYELEQVVESVHKIEVVEDEDFSDADIQEDNGIEQEPKTITIN